MNMQLRQCCARAKPFRLKKSGFVGLFFISKKSEFQNLASKKRNWQSCMSDPLPAEEGCETCYQIFVLLVLLRNNNTAINLQMLTSSYGR